MPRFPALFAVLACLLGACSRSPTPIAERPPPRSGPRIVALSPAIAVTLRDLGLGEHIVGRHGFDMWTDVDIPVCGDQGGMDYEALLRAAPTDVLVQFGNRPLPPRMVSLASERGWRVRTFDPLTLEQVRAMAVDLHALYGGDGKLIDRLDRAWSARADVNGEAIGPVALIDGDSSAGLSGLAFLGPGSFHHDLLVRLGGTPAAVRGSPFMILDAEDLARLAPRAVIAFAPGGDASASRASLESRLCAIGVPAARGGAHTRIAVVTEPTALLPGSNLLKVADEMARILAEWSARGMEDQLEPAGGG